MARATSKESSGGGSSAGEILQVVETAAVAIGSIAVGVVAFIFSPLALPAAATTAIFTSGGAAYGATKKLETAHRNAEARAAKKEAEKRAAAARKANNGSRW